MTTPNIKERLEREIRQAKKAGDSEVGISFEFAEKLQAQLTAPLPDEVEAAVSQLRKGTRLISRDEYADLIERQAKALSWAHDVNDAAEAENNRLYEQAQCSATGQCECWKAACKNESNNTNKHQSEVIRLNDVLKRIHEDSRTSDYLRRFIEQECEYARANTEGEG